MKFAPRGLVAAVHDRKMIVGWHEQHRRFFSEVTPAPVLPDRVGDFAQPNAVFGEFEDFQGAKIFDRIWFGIAQWPKQARRHQNRHIVGLAIERPSHFSCRQTRREPAHQAEKTMSIFVQDDGGIDPALHHCTLIRREGGIGTEASA